MNDTILMQYSYWSLGSIQKNLKDYEQAKIYYKKLQELNTIYNKRGATYRLNLHHVVSLLNLGVVYAYQGNNERAIEYYKDVLTYIEETNLDNFIRTYLTALTNLIRVTEANEELTALFSKLEKAALFKFNRPNTKYLFNKAYYTYYIKTAQATVAEVYLNRLMKHYEYNKEKNPNSHEDVEQIKTPIAYYKLIGDYEKAISIENLYHRAKDSVLSLKIFRETQELVTIYESEKKDNEIIYQKAIIKNE